MGEFSPWHILVIVVIVLLLFGPKKLPEFARSLGESIREFKKSFSDGMHSEVTTEEKKTPEPPKIIVK